MSVSLTTSVFIDVVPREQGLPVGTPALIGRWHFNWELQGDASGGAYLVGGYFQNVLGMFGQHAIWTMTQLGFFTSANLVSPECQLAIEPNDRSTYAPVPRYRSRYALSCQAQPLLGSVVPYYIVPIHGLTYFRFSDIPGIPSQVSINLAPNTNLVTFVGGCMGDIYDERMI